MIWKKTWFSYILWAFYIIVTCIFLAMGIGLMTTWIKNGFMVMGIVCLFFVGLAAIYFLLQFCVDSLSDGKNIEKKTKSTVQNLILFIGTSVWCVICVLMIFETDATGLAESEYLKNSFVDGVTKVPDAAYGAEWMFLRSLRGLFIVFGNHAKAAIWFQFCLHLLSSFILYHGVKKLAENMAGMIAYLGSLFVPLFVKEFWGLQPVWVALFAFSFGFYILASVLYRRRNKTERSKVVNFLGYLGMILLGIYFALVIYLDIYGLLLLFFGISILWSLPETRKEQRSIPMRPLQVFCLIIGCIGGIVSFVCLRVSLYGLDSRTVINNWWQTYGAELDGRLLLNLEGSGLLAFTLLAVALYWGVFRFLKESNEESLSGFMLLVGVMVVLQFSGISANNTGNIWMFWIMILCAAACLGRCFIPSEEKEIVGAIQDELMEETIEELKAIVQPKYIEKDKTIEQPKQEEQIKPILLPQVEIDLDLPIKEEKITSVQKPVSAENLISAEKRVPVEKSEPVKKPAPKLLHNPLPGPKKHVPKVLDYDLIEVEDFEKNYDDYDIEVSEFDDYDIK